MGKRWVAITDNADPMNVVVYRRGADVRGRREVCRVPVFHKGASATENSLIAAGRAMVASVPKLSLANGLVYTVTKDPAGTSDVWCLAALDFRTGKLVYKYRYGTGPGFNPNYAPVSIGEHGEAYVGVLDGLVRIQDSAP
jgi:hypothetical protein